MMMFVHGNKADCPPELRGATFQRASPDREPPCCSTEDMLRYLFNAIDPMERSRLEAHIFECPRCHANLEGLRLGFEMCLESEDLEG